MILHYVGKGGRDEATELIVYIERLVLTEYVGQEEVGWGQTAAYTKRLVIELTMSEGGSDREKEREGRGERECTFQPVSLPAELNRTGSIRVNCTTTRTDPIHSSLRLDPVIDIP